MNFPDERTLFIRDALRSYKSSLESLVGDKLYSLRICPDDKPYLTVKDGKTVDRRVWFRDQYLAKIAICDELLQLITPTPD